MYVWNYLSTCYLLLWSYGSMYLNVKLIIGSLYFLKKIQYINVVLTGSNHRQQNITVKILILNDYSK